MAKAAKKNSSEEMPMMRPALTPEARENQLISLAVDLAEKQLREGTASSQVITHYLKLGSSRERLEKDILKKQGVLLDTKADAQRALATSDETMKEALDAFRRYSGHSGEEYEY